MKDSKHNTSEEQQSVAQVDRRLFMKSSGAALLAAAAGLPARAASQEQLQLLLATPSDPFRRLMTFGLRPELRRATGIDVYFPELQQATNWSDRRVALERIIAAAQRSHLDLIALDEGLLAPLVSQMGNQLVDMRISEELLQNYGIDYIHSEGAIHGFQHYDNTVLVGLSRQAEAAMPHLLAVLGTVRRHQVFIQASSRHIANGEDPALVEIQIADHKRRPFTERVFVSVSMGGFRERFEASPVGNGEYRLELPMTYAGHAHLTVTDATGQQLDLEAGWTDIDFLPGPVTHWNLRSIRGVADADGRDAVLCRAMAFDHWGNPVHRGADDVDVDCDLGQVRAVSKNTHLELEVRSTDFGQSTVTITDKPTGSTAEFMASFPQLRLGDGKEFVVVLPPDNSGEPSTTVDMPVYAYSPDGQELTGARVVVDFDDTMCYVEEVRPSDDVVTTSFRYSVNGGQITIDQTFEPASGRVCMANITMGAHEEGYGQEIINPELSYLRTMTGTSRLSLVVVAPADKKHTKIEKEVTLNFKIVKGTGGASLGTEAEAKAKICKGFDKINKIFCPAKIRFKKKVSTINCDLGANGLDEYKGPNLTGEEKAVIDKCKPPKGEISVFFVGQLSCGSLGESISSGQFPGEVANGRTGSVFVDDAYVENTTTTAHEIGHILLGNGAHPAKSDFPTCQDYEDNLMHPTNPNPDKITDDQAKKMRENICKAQGDGTTPGTGF